jgi:hypothetical protein
MSLLASAYLVWAARGQKGGHHHHLLLAMEVWGRVKMGWDADV